MCLGMFPLALKTKEGMKVKVHEMVGGWSCGNEKSKMEIKLAFDTPHQYTPLLKFVTIVLQI